jgi:hypothetical protein
MRRLTGLALAAAACAACSLLIGAEPEPLRCTEEGRLGPPACDSGQVCRTGVCEPAPMSAAGSEG